MLDNARIKAWAEKAARVAYAILGLNCPYSVSLINDPAIPEDAQLDTQKNEVQINLAALEPFSAEVMPTSALTSEPTSTPVTDEDRQLDEDYRLMMKVYYLVYHEMRHLYQKQAVNAYAINKRLGGRKTAPHLESDKKCALWLKEMKEPGPDQDIEEDANDFAYYLSNRFPAQLPMQRTSRRLGAMKRKYDKVEIPEDITGKTPEKKSFTIDTSMNGIYTISEDRITRQSIQGEQISKGLLVKNHFQDAELALYTAWVLREGKCYEAKTAWYHTEEDLKDAPHLEKVLDAMEAQLDKLTDGEYISTVDMLKQERPSLDGHKLWSEIQDVWWEIKGLREGKYHGSKAPKYEGRRGIPRIETTGGRLVDAIMDLIWKMDNEVAGAEEDDGMDAFWKSAEELMPKDWPEDWE